MAKVAGIVEVYVNSELKRSLEGATLDIGGKEREMLTGHKVYGYKEKVMPSVCEFTLALMSDTDLIALRDIVDASLRFATDVGIVYLVTGACVTKTLKVKGTDGEVDVEMQGNPAETE